MRLLSLMFRHISRRNFSQGSTAAFELSQVCDNCKWGAVLEDSYRMVGIPDSHTSPGCIPVEKVAHRLQNAQGSRDHIANVFRQLSSNSERGLQWPGIVSTLFAKAATEIYLGEKAWRVQQKQQMALMTALNQLHYYVVFNKLLRRADALTKTVHADARQLANTYFMSDVIYRIGKLRNDRVVSNIAFVIDFLGTEQHIDYNRDKLRFFKSLTDWENQKFHQERIIVANGCQSSLQLANHLPKVVELGYQFGRFFTLATGANRDLQDFLNYKNSIVSTISLRSLPIVLHLERNIETQTFISLCEKPLNNLDLHDIFVAVESSGSLVKAKQQLHQYTEMCLAIINEFKESSSASCLVQLIEALNKLDE